MQPYGTYKGHTRDPSRWYYGYPSDTQEVQDAVAPGVRMRNRKAKRRVHNKVTRQALKMELKEQHND